MLRPRWHLAHVVLIPLSFMLLLYQHEMYVVGAGEAVLPTAILLVAASLIWVAGRRILPDTDKAALIVSAGFVAFLTYGRAFLILASRLERFAAWAQHALLIGGAALVLCAVSFTVLRTRQELTSVNRFLTIMALSLMAISVGSIAHRRVQYMKLFAGNLVVDADKQWSRQILREGRRLPDVYYIILDAYASESALRNIYGYDNSEFIQSLKSKGFYVASGSWSNYDATCHSIPSSLNMTYLDGLTEAVGQNCRDIWPLYAMAVRSRAAELYRSRGYRFVHFTSGFAGTGSAVDCDVLRSTARPTAFMDFMFRNTGLALIGGLLPGWQRRGVISTFEELADVPTIEGPTFCFAHLRCPHDCLFARDGGHPEGLTTGKTAYVECLQYTNTQVERLVGALLSKSDPAPVIILQGDHGSRSFADWGFRQPVVAELTADRGREDAEDLFGILNAYYLPEGGEDLLYDTISPVNSFRVIFNRYFGGHYELLEDKSYLGWYGYPYQFALVSRER